MILIYNYIKILINMAGNFASVNRKKLDQLLAKQGFKHEKYNPGYYWFNCCRKINSY